ncbi:MAG TPA: hypothetical protein VEU62_06780 [Bryobacterales bacterium]|nr:hypothetical protein [Bryobacterales bacterium]
MEDPVQTLLAIRTWLGQRPEVVIIAGVWLVMAALFCLLAIFQIGRKPGGPQPRFRFVGYAANLVLAIGAFASVMYLMPRYMLENAQATVRGYAERAKLVAPYPLRWKPGEGGAVKQLRFQGDRLEIETLRPTPARHGGEFALAELRKQGSKYVGVTEDRFTCVWQDATAEEHHKECTEELSIEMTSFTPHRIEGRVQSYRGDSAFNCQKCAHSGPPSWRPFVWIPE